MMRRPNWTLLFFCALLCWSGSAEAEDATDFETARKALPAASDEHAFDQYFDLSINGHAVAKAQLSAQPTARKGEQRGWKIREFVRVAIPNGPTQERTLEAEIDHALRPLHGRIETTDSSGATTRYSWKVLDKGFQVTMSTPSDAAKDTNYKGTERTIEEEQTSIHGMTSLLLFARQVLPKAGSYKTHVIKPDFNLLKAERPYEAASLELDPKASHEGKPAWRFIATRSNKKLEALVDPETRDLLWMRGTSEGGPVLLFTPSKASPKQDTLDAAVFKQPARSAVAAALRTAYAIKTADLEVMDSVAHWPSIRKALGSRVPAKVEQDRFEEMMRQGFKQQVEAVDTPEKAKSYLLAIQDEITTRVLDSGATEVTLPAKAASRPLVVQEIEGVWYLVEFPLG